jgi:two-component system, OmpR family, sensor histidine kinase KdpD
MTDLNIKRPSPDLLLKRFEEEQRQENGGNLKIYLGAAPGVGKTYAMLQDAISQRNNGIDVVVGIAESHGRNEIESLLDQSEVLPRIQIDYRGNTLSEFNLDGALKRNPRLILVDEMAHTNVPGQRNAKRWQDIEELLSCGMDVYTTLNVQHIESLKDSVSNIISAPVQETVPDPMLEQANMILLVDLPPEDLLKRLQEGKVYFPKQAELARKNFFRKGNLIALRELALRITADRVGRQLQEYRHEEGIQDIWATNEKLLVCAGPGKEALTLIRSACQKATRTNAKWFAIYVENPDAPIPSADSKNGISNLKFAEQLGAEIKVLSGINIVKEILFFARSQNVTQIMIGKYIHPRFINLFHRSGVDELIRNSNEIEICVVRVNLDSNE